ncbi:MAG: hypothetical protein G8D79_15720 [gamma proteobacterium symbiont of Ctena orbiculata]|uniref:SIR2-like domain-containing protein n=2 Tax=Candidatus Thiodiazotropha endolucinida TaxID=1655433 RepID=A0A7Z1AE79_9GAMM|nr:hypothetical protein CODIS_30440 [Candidatus Thiodiazotropha endolucinida]
MDAFEYVVDKILNKCCVPVAGAGISVSSTHSDGGERFHTVDWMVDKLKRKLLSKRYNRYDKNLHGSICNNDYVDELKALDPLVDENNLIKSKCFFCDVREAAKDYKLGELSELYLWEFRESNDAYQDLVKLLQIAKYKDLQPTKAHIAIAKLAREGLLSEVLTTNYDCNFEKAYEEISGGEHFDKISSLDDYRKKGAKNGVINRLRVYKVNGCSEKLGDGSDPQKCESILLTERQLQKWRNRQWASDIFRDRLRSKSLIFTGFGSNEPQVHHTVQTVLDEYTDELGDNFKPVLETPAAPIVAIFESQPSFHQQQIVKTYALHHKQDPQDGDQLIIRHPETGNNLSANDLWEDIYERVIRSVILKALRLSQLSTNASFTAIVPFASTIMHQVISSIDKAEGDDQKHFTKAPDWLNSFTSICGNDAVDGKHFSALVGCLSVLNAKETGLYDPVEENKALMSELLLLLYLLKGVLADAIDVTNGKGVALIFKTTEKGSSTNKVLYLNADPAVARGGNNVGVPSGNNYLTITLGQAGAHIRPDLRRDRAINKCKKTITPKTIVTLGWKHIFYQTPYEGNMESVADTILDAIDSPTNYYYANQPSIKRRPYLKPEKDN